MWTEQQQQQESKCRFRTTFEYVDLVFVICHQNFVFVLFFYMCDFFFGLLWLLYLLLLLFLRHIKLWCGVMWVFWHKCQALMIEFRENPGHSEWHFKKIYNRCPVHQFSTLFRNYKKKDVLWNKTWWDFFI